MSLCRGCPLKRSCPEQGLMPAGISCWVFCLFGYLGCALGWSEAHHLLYWFWVYLGGVPMRSILDAAISLELPIWNYQDIHCLCVPLLGLGIMGGPGCVQRSVSSNYVAGGSSIKGLRHSKICLTLSAALQPPEAACSSLRVLQRKSVA